MCQLVPVSDMLDITCNWRHILIYFHGICDSGGDPLLIPYKQGDATTIHGWHLEDTDITIGLTYKDRSHRRVWS